MALSAPSNVGTFGEMYANLRGGALPAGRFKAVEDLLQVPGVSRALYDGVVESLSATSSGQAGVDWQSAPVSVIAALAQMDPSAALEFANSRQANGNATTQPPAAELESWSTLAASPMIVRIDALVEVDGTVYRRRRWVDRQVPGADGLPWRFVRTEAVVAASAVERKVLKSKVEQSLGS
jgi:hypothetical protein